jgi:ABC-type Mn2+/Zn2+ transport system ATPase subunit
VRDFFTGYGKKQVLFDVMPGEIILITGGNGSGRSALLKAIYGLLQPWNADEAIIVSHLRISRGCAAAMNSLMSASNQFPKTA